VVIGVVLYVAFLFWLHPLPDRVGAFGALLRIGLTGPFFALQNTSYILLRVGYAVALITGVRAAGA
jgi:hypothetical protein